MVKGAKETDAATPARTDDAGVGNIDQVILDHRIEGPYFQYRQSPSWAATCKCGHTFFAESSGEVSREWAMHVAAATSPAPDRGEVGQ